MNRCPAIGIRVRYRKVWHKGETYQETREVTGTVMKHYPAYADKFDRAGNLVARGDPKPERCWSVGVKVDSKPAWWPYPNTDRFAPDVKDLTEIKGRAEIDAALAKALGAENA